MNKYTFCLFMEQNFIVEKVSKAIDIIHGTDDI